MIIEHEHDWQSYPEFSNRWLEICAICGASRTAPDEEREL